MDVPDASSRSQRCWNMAEDGAQFASAHPSNTAAEKRAPVPRLLPGLDTARVDGLRRGLEERESRE